MPAVASALAMTLLLPAAKAASLCMEFQDGRPLGWVQVSPCDGSLGQQWSLMSHYSPSTFLIAPMSSPDYCLAAASAKDGDGLYIGDCDDSLAPWPGMLWDFEEGSYQIRANGQDQCVDAGDMSVGFPLMIEDCNGLSQQKWGYDADMKTIYLSDSRRLRGGLSSAMAESMPKASSRSLRGSPPAEKARVNTSRESGGITCEGVAGELQGTSSSFCCGDANFQIVCAPGSKCGGTSEEPLCEGPVQCAGRAGITLQGVEGSVCCGDVGRQIVCGRGAACGGSPDLPTCAESPLAGPLLGSRSGGVTCDGQGGELEGAAGSFCCGDRGKQIVCAPGSACGEGQDGMPICQVPGGIACQGVAGELRGAAGSKCCGASGHQIVCGPGSHCAGSEEAPICGGPVTCAGRAGIPVTAAAGSICCGDEGFQIACGPGARCAGRPHLPICLAR